jgi:hypothetical protein
MDRYPLKIVYPWKEPSSVNHDIAAYIHQQLEGDEGFLQRPLSASARQKTEAEIVMKANGM